MLTSPGSADDSGFSLVEVVVAMVVFAIMVSAALGILFNTLDVTKDNAHRVAAANLATKQIEVARSRLAIDIPDGATSRTEAVAGTTYTITQNANYIVAGSDTSLCEATGAPLAHKLVTVTVTWPDMGSVAPVRSDTIKALGVGDEGLDEALGSLAVGVSGADGGPVSGVTVTLMPGNVQRTTGIDGCAVFVGLNVAAGGTDYTASVNQPGHVGSTNNQFAQVVEGVLAGQVAQADLVYDAARTLTVQTDVPVGHTAPADLPVGFRSSYVGAGAILPPSTCTPTVGTQACASSLPGNVHHLFPTVAEVWAGPCAYPRPAGTTVGADLTAADGSVTVPLEGVHVEVVDALNAPQSGYTVTARSSCSGAQEFALPTTGADGSRGALPAGTWTVTVTSPGGVVAEQTVVLDPGQPVQELLFVAATP